MLPRVWLLFHWDLLPTYIVEKIFDATRLIDRLAD